MLPGPRLPFPALVAAADPEGLPDGAGLPDAPMYAGIASEGEPSAYSQVWEWGNSRQTKKGPKTTMGINPDGQRVWLTIQAPYGYVRLNAPRFAAAIEDELSRVDPLDKHAGPRLEEAMLLAAQRCAALVRDTAPVDTGALMDSVQPTEVNDPDVLAADKWSEGSFHEAFGDEEGGG